MFALNQHVLATLVKNWQCLVEQRGMFGRPSDSISRGLETRPAINLLQTISLHCSFIMGIGQQLQRLNLFSKWNPNCSESPWHFLPMMQTLYYAIDTQVKTGSCWGQDPYSLVIDRPILALMVVNHRKPKSSEEKVQTHPPASSFCNIVSWILNLFFLLQKSHKTLFFMLFWWNDFLFSFYICFLPDRDRTQRSFMESLNVKQYVGGATCDEDQHWAPDRDANIPLTVNLFSFFCEFAISFAP